MNDILPTLRKLAEKHRIKYDCDLLTTESKSEDMNLECKEFKKFMDKVSKAQMMIKSITKNNEKLKNYKEELSISIGEKQKAISETISQIIDENISLQDKTKTLVSENYEEFIKDLDFNSNVLEQEKRIARNLHGSTVKHFQDIMLEFQSIEGDIKSANQAMIVRSAEIAMSRKLSKEEQENIINNPSIIQKYMEAKLSGQAHIKLQNAVRDLDERHHDLIKLEKNINQVHVLITELATLVHLQGEMIDNICENISQAKKDVMAAEVDVFKSTDNMKSARNKKCCIILLVVGILVVIVAPILGVKLSSS